MGDTQKNLMAAFAGESQANRKYLAFARKADEEGLTGVARLFRAAAEAETIHAHNHLDALKGVKSTLENLREAYGGEHYEFTEMYPVFLAKSKEEKEGTATKTFHYANEVEKIHGELYRDAINQLESAGRFPDREYYVCRTCGYTVADGAPDKCPVCAAKKDAFFKVS